METKCHLHQIADAIRQVSGEDKKIKGDDLYKEILKLTKDTVNELDNVPKHQGGEIIPTTKDIVIKKGQYLEGDIVVKGDPNLKSENIIRGKNDKLISIFGVQGTSDRMRRIRTDITPNTWHGEHVVDVARSYHLARMNGDAEFRYSQSKGIWDTENGLLTDEEGRCWLDCSGFVGLVLRGIEFKDSPYYLAKGKPNVKLSDLGMDNTIIKTLCENSKHEWADIYLDRQVISEFRDIGVPNMWSIRTAGQIAEYYFNQGKCIYRWSKGNYPIEVPSGLCAGDLLFWSKDFANDQQKSRFKAISHVGIVGRDCEHFFQVTGYADERETATAFESLIADHLDELCLIVRPSYKPVNLAIPYGVNLLSTYCFDNCQVSPYVDFRGVRFNMETEGGFSVRRIETATDQIGATFYIVKEENAKKLTKGTYHLSGAETCSQASDNLEIRDYGLMLKTTDGTTLKDSNGIEVIDKGNGCTFKVNATTYVYFYMFYGANLTEKCFVKPSLVKI